MNTSNGQHLGGGLYYHAYWNNNPRSIRFFFPLEPDCKSWLETGILVCPQCKQEYHIDAPHEQGCVGVARRRHRLGQL